LERLLQSLYGVDASGDGHGMTWTYPCNGTRLTVVFATVIPNY